MTQTESSRGIISRLISWGHIKSNNEDDRIMRTTLWLTAVPFSFAGFAWGIGYFLHGLYIPGAIPFCYGLISLTSSLYFRYSQNFKFYLNIQIFLILILPFSLQISLGGFVPSSAVILWAIISPIGAMFFMGTKASIKWFVAFLVLLFVAWAADGYLANYIQRDLGDRFINNLFLLNFIGVFVLVYGILFYFINSQVELKEKIATNNKELINQASKLKELDTIKSRFFANISHEFRTPLTLILGLASKQQSQPGVAPSEKDTATIHRNSQRLLQLINQLLDLSKLEAGALRLEASLDNISQFTKIHVEQFDSLAYDKKIKLTFNGRSSKENNVNETLDLYFDHEKLEKILTNLISNAVKFTPIDGVIDVQLLSNSEWVKILVSNSGEGIPQDQLGKVFDRFYQVDGDSTRLHEGTGIGLALVKELTELHHGTIHVESSNERTTFTLSLPRNPDYLKEEEKTSLGSLEAKVEKEVMTISDNIESKSTPIISDEQFEGTEKLEILIVEDNPDLRDFIASILESQYRVVQAVDGIDGFEKAESMTPDLIISDVMMPRMDGNELCVKLKSNDKTNHIPVILLTAKASRENRLEGLETGADDYLIKPFDQQELLIRIKNLISIREKLQCRYKQDINLKPSSVKVTSVHQKFIERLKEVIEENIDKSDLSVEGLASEMAMSRSQLHHKLKALTDQSASAFIRNYRLHRAAELIKKDSGNITEIAYSVGFNSQTYFSSSFQELFGCSPSDYKDLGA